MQPVPCAGCQALQRRLRDLQGENERLRRQLDEAIRFGVILRNVWGGSRPWVCAQAQSVLMSVWRTCWQQGRCARDFLSQLLRGLPVASALPP
jgi:hypothetical protein